MSFFMFTLTAVQHTQHTYRSAARRSHLLAGSAIVCTLMLAMPGAASAQTVAQNAAASPAAPLQPNPAYAHYPRYIGTLGTRHITLRLEKTDHQADTTAQNMQGEYQFDTTNEVRQIAGERDGNTFAAEDTADGVNIAGNWDGTFAADGSLTGTRTNDDSGSQPFELKPVSPDGSLQTPASTPTDANAPVSPATKTGNAAPSGNGNTHQVEGISNLNTED